MDGRESRWSYEISLRRKTFFFSGWRSIGRDVIYRPLREYEKEIRKKKKTATEKREKGEEVEKAAKNSQLPSIAERRGVSVQLGFLF